MTIDNPPAIVFTKQKVTDNFVRCYDLAIKALRDRYLKERLEGEMATQWLSRRILKKILPKSCDGIGSPNIYRYECGVSVVAE